MVIAMWSSRYETGIELIDAQHQALFGAFNELADSFRAGTSSEHVKASLGALMAYTVGHFQTEETYMRERNYPGLSAHQAEHARLVNMTQDLLTRFDEGRPVTMEVAIFLADLLKHHIDEFDLAMVRFLTEIPPTVTVERH
jgi:hemerythrin